MDSNEIAEKSSAADELQQLLGEASQVFSDYVRQSLDDATPVVGDSGDLDLTLPDEAGAGAAGIWDDVRAVCGAATNTWSARFLYKLYAAPTAVGVVGEALMGLLNNNAHVLQASPVGAAVEAAVARRLAELAGLPAATAGGLTFPGGAYANIHALMVARNRRFPELVRGGMGGLRGAPVVFTSTHAHFSIEKAAVAAGIGLDHVERVPTDSNGRMDGVALRRQVERAVARGDLPFFVNATAGTTVLGAFDPVDAIADVCADHGLWLHVDGAWGGPLALFCKDVCNVSGLHRADSLSVSAHKLLGVPLQCSFLLVRAGLGVMRDALGLGAQYLFHGDEDDVGDATLGCGRRPDAIKLWLAWRYYGTRHFRARLMAARARARALAAAVAARPACATGVWRLVAAPQSTCVCFWFVPGARAGGPPQPWWGRATALLCRHVNAAGHVLIDYAAVDLPGGALPAFFRVPLNSPHVSSRTLEAVLDAIEAAAEALAGDLELLRRADGPPGDGPPREAPSPPSLP